MKQKDTFQTKGQGKYPEQILMKQILSDFPEREFNVIVKKMLTKVRRASMNKEFQLK